MYPVRTSAKALIIRDGKILMTRNEDALGVFYLFPGGGQECNETLPETLRRECREEISSEVEVGELLYVWEYIADNHEFAGNDPGFHQLQCLFTCTLLSENLPSCGHVPDTMQTGVAWLDIAKLSEYRIYPAQLVKRLGSQGKNDMQFYLGDIN